MAGFLGENGEPPSRVFVEDANGIVWCLDKTQQSNASAKVMRDADTPITTK
jgi:hypothetical protein